jgi:hypothetical protein
MNSGSTGGGKPDSASGPFDVLKVIAQDTPTWARSMALLGLVGSLVALVVIACAAIVRGQEVSLWPPRIERYVSPLEANCKEMNANLVEVRKETHELLERQQDRIRTTLDGLSKTRQQYNDSVVKNAPSAFLQQSIEEQNDLLTHLENALTDRWEDFSKKLEETMSRCLRQ